MNRPQVSQKEKIKINWVWSFRRIYPRTIHSMEIRADFVSACRASAGSTRLITTRLTMETTQEPETGSRSTTAVCLAIAPAGSVAAPRQKWTHHDKKCERDNIARNLSKHMACAKQRVIHLGLVRVVPGLFLQSRLSAGVKTPSHWGLAISNYFHLSAITSCFESWWASSSNMLFKSAAAALHDKPCRGIFWPLLIQFAFNR